MNTQKIAKYLTATLLLLLLQGCTISYRFNGASIDYTKTKSISIDYFPNRARMVVPSLSQDLTQGLQDIFTRQTRLDMLPNGGDLEIEGEITGCDITNMGVKAADSYTSETRLSVTVQVRFINNTDPTQDLNQSFSAFRVYDNASSTLDEAQATLLPEIIEELADLIFNATVGRW